MSGTTTIDSSGTLSAEYTGGNYVIEDNSALFAVDVVSNTGSFTLDAGSTITVQQNASLGLEPLLTVASGDAFVIGQNGTIDLVNGVNAGVISDITFASGDTGNLVLTSEFNLPVTAGISGFAPNDVIDFSGVGAAVFGTGYTDTYSSTTGDTAFTIALTSGLSETFALKGDYTSDSFSLGHILLNETVTFTEVACFAPGTRILTTEGEIAVEHLAPGDIAVLADGATSKITFIGHRQIDPRRHPRPENVSPIRIAPGALADGIPSRPLILSPDHAIFIDDVLVQAKDLVDGIAIIQDMNGAAIRYFHVELETHGILLAEGAPAESFLDTGHRGIFENANTPLILHPDLMQLRREAESVAPLVTGGEVLDGIRARLHARKLMLGLAPAEARVFALKCGDLMLSPAENLPSRVSFTLPEGVVSAVFFSAMFVPAELDPFSDDRRRLGVAIAEILLDGRSVPLEHVIRPAEMHRRAPCETATWTSGATTLAIPPGIAVITFNLSAVPRIWRDTRSRQSDVA
jgi:hypothetical protein